MSKKNKKKGYKEELEERLISLIASLFGKKASEFLSDFCFECLFPNQILFYLSWFLIILSIRICSGPQKKKKKKLTHFE